MKVFENGPQNGDFENAGLSFSCGQTKTEVFECDDVIDLVQSIQEWKIKMADRQLVSLLLGRLSSLIACIQLHFTLFKLTMWGSDWTELLSAPVSRTGAVKRLKRRPATPRRFWVRPGRSSAWWDTLVNQIVAPEELRENFREFH